MKKDLKCLIDALLFVTITSMTAVGLLLAWVLPSGRQVGESKFFMGLHRHQWADIHRYFAYFFLTLLALHLWLNWTWISQAARSYVGDYWKNALLALCGAWLLIVFAAWLLVRF